MTEVVVEETYFAEGRRDGATGDFDSNFGADQAQSSDTGATSEFEVSSGDDLPF